MRPAPWRIVLFVTASLVPGAASGQGGPPYGLTSRPAATPYLSMPTDETGPMPATLSLTGAFSDTATLTPAASLIPYAPNSPLWSDGTVKTRWISLPTGSTITFAATGEWTHPPGTVIVKHFELLTDETNPATRTRLETRLLVVKANGTVYGVTYKWRANNSDADLLPGSLSEPHTIAQAGGGSHTQTYTYPGPSDCLGCHTQAANFVLSLNTKQLNGNFLYPSLVTDNQLRTWSYIGMFNVALNEASIPGYDAMVPVDDAGATLERRVKSYLHANCSNCHRPGGPGLGIWDGRYETPMASQNIVGGAVNNTLGIDGALEVAPRDIWRSVMHVRMSSTGSFKMPTIDRNVNDAAALAALTQWIDSLAGTPALAPPAVSPDGGFYSGPVTVSFQHPDPMATLRYTTDGSDPTLSSTPYGGPFVLSTNATIRARAFRSGYATSVASFADFIFGAPPAPEVLTPTISPNGGAFTAPATVTLATPTPGAEIRYTTDGSQPTTLSRQYTGPIVIGTTSTLKVRGFAAAMNPSPIASAVFVFSAPVFVGGGGGGGGCGATGWEALLLLGAILAARRRYFGRGPISTLRNSTSVPSA